MRLFRPHAWPEPHYSRSCDRQRRTYRKEQLQISRHARRRFRDLCKRSLQACMALLTVLGPVLRAARPLVVWSTLPASQVQAHVEKLLGMGSTGSSVHDPGADIPLWNLACSVVNILNENLCHGSFLERQALACRSTGRHLRSEPNGLPEVRL